MPYPEKFRKSLQEHKVEGEIVNHILNGYDDVIDKSPKKKKIAFFTQAMKKMDEVFDFDTRYRIVDWCACCKGGKRAKDIKEMSKKLSGKSLEEKLEALCRVPNMSRPSLNKDGTITTRIDYIGKRGYKCACPCFHNEEIKEPISATYCLCCAGHFRHHYQNALGVELKTKKVLSSAIESLGRKPCVFNFEIRKSPTI
jgi:hypothetical protein